MAIAVVLITLVTEAAADGTVISRSRRRAGLKGVDLTWKRESVYLSKATLNK